jgi:hypothetical protein
MTAFVIAYISAHFTQMQFRFQLQQRIRQMSYLHFRSLQQINHQSQGSSLPDARKRRKGLNRLFNNA